MQQKHLQEKLDLNYIAFDLEYIIKEEFEMLLNSVTEISKLLSGFIKYLESSRKV